MAEGEQEVGQLGHSEPLCNENQAAARVKWRNDFILPVRQAFHLKFTFNGPTAKLYAFSFVERDAVA